MYTHSAGTRVKTQGAVTAVDGNKRGDLELVNYIGDGAQDLVLDFSMRHSRGGAAPRNWHRTRRSAAWGLLACIVACWPWCTVQQDCNRSLTDRRHAALSRFRSQVPQRCWSGLNWTDESVARILQPVRKENPPFSAFAVPIGEIRGLSYFLRDEYEMLGCRVPAVPVNDAGLLRLPETTTRLKIDVGLAFNAPHSQLWLEKIPGLAVFGFEPNLQAVSDILSGSNRGKIPSRSDFRRRASYLDTNFVGSTFFLFPVALGSQQGQVSFHATTGDPSHSSLLQPDPASHAYDVYPVPIVPLADLLSRIPWGFEGDPGVFPIVEHIKVDAQGHDVEILRGAGHYLRERVVCVTAEKTAGGYVQPGHEEQDLLDFMFHEGFYVLRDVGESYTFVNTNLTAWLEDVDCSGGDLFVLHGCLQDAFGNTHSCPDKKSSGQNRARPAM